MNPILALKHCKIDYLCSDLTVFLWDCKFYGQFFRQFHIKGVSSRKLFRLTGHRKTSFFNKIGHKIAQKSWVRPKKSHMTLQSRLQGGLERLI